MYDRRMIICYICANQICVFIDNVLMSEKVKPWVEFKPSRCTYTCWWHLKSAMDLYTIMVQVKQLLVYNLEDFSRDWLLHLSSTHTNGHVIVTFPRHSNTLPHPLSPILFHSRSKNWLLSNIQQMQLYLPVLFGRDGCLQTYDTVSTHTWLYYRLLALASGICS